MEKNPEAELRVYAVWFDVLSADDRSAWSADLMADPRVAHLWDEGRVLGTWLPKQERYRDLISVTLAWDIYFLYGPDAGWSDVPWPLVDSGSTILGKKESLREHLVPMLARA